jgi:vacuolar-type H+-ATPase subunit I/STV1
MGFFAMVLSFLLGIFFTVIGVVRRKQNVIYKLFIVLGIALLIVAVYLARPQ